MLEITSTEDLAIHLEAMADVIVSADPTTFTDQRVADACRRVSRAIEGSLLDGMVITGEHEAIGDGQ